MVFLNKKKSLLLSIDIKQYLFMLDNTEFCILLTSLCVWAVCTMCNWCVLCGVCVCAMWDVCVLCVYVFMHACIYAYVWYIHVLICTCGGMCV